MTHHAPEFRHPDEMDWEMGRFRNVTKFLFHPTPDRPTTPNVGFLRYEPGAGFPLHKHDFAQVWYVIDGEFRMGERTYGPGTIVFMEDPHFENEMRTETGGTVLFVQYPGPTTGARPIYDGRMNLKAVPRPEELDLEHGFFWDRGAPAPLMSGPGGPRSQRRYTSWPVWRSILMPETFFSAAAASAMARERWTSRTDHAPTSMPAKPEPLAGAMSSTCTIEVRGPPSLIVSRPCDR
jgi:hypothetical protein